MNKKGVRGKEGKYPCENPETSNKRRLKEYDDTLEEVNFPPPKMQKFNMGLSDGEMSSSDDDLYDEYGSEDGSEDESGYEDEEEHLQDNLVHEDDPQQMNIHAPQKCPSVGSSPKVDPVPKDHSQATNDDNQGDSTSHPKKRSRAKLEETCNVLLQSQQTKKSKMPQLTLQKKVDDKTSMQSLQEEVKKPRKFQTPLHMDEMQAIKCGMEVGLASPNSKKMVAMGTVQNTDSRAKASDGNPLADCVEVLISVVFNQTTMLPRGHGKIQKLGSATAHCIAWPQ